MYCVSTWYLYVNLKLGIANLNKRHLLAGVPQPAMMLQAPARLLATAVLAATLGHCVGRQPCQWLEFRLGITRTPCFRVWIMHSHEIQSNAIAKYNKISFVRLLLNLKLLAGKKLKRYFKLEEMSTKSSTVISGKARYVLQPMFWVVVF